VSNKPLRIVVLISGGGSNLQSIIDSIEAGDIKAEICAVISNRPGAGGLQRAAKHGIAAHALDHKNFDSRESFDGELQGLIDTFSPDLVVLAGFMRILSPTFTENYLGRMMNIHPSLLPKYQGLNTHQRAIDNGDSEHGASVHFVTAELDGGPVIIQAKVPVLPGDTKESLAERVLKQEHLIYPQAVAWFAEGRLEMKNGKCLLDGESV